MLVIRFIEVQVMIVKREVLFQRLLGVIIEIEILRDVLSKGGSEFFEMRILENNLMILQSIYLQLLSDLELFVKIGYEKLNMIYLSIRNLYLIFF